MENEEKQIILKSPADLAVHATRANLGNPHVHFVIDSNLKHQCESDKKNLLAPETLLAYNAVRKKLDPEFNDSIEKQLDELENLGH
jgi:hypothetical protein